MKFKPMLAGEIDLVKLIYPVFVSPKLDGVRATFVEGQLLTRSLKPLANPRVAEAIVSGTPLDGELIVGDPFGPSVFRDTMKVVSSHSAPIDGLKFWVFDCVGSKQFHQRLHDAREAAQSNQRMVYVPHTLIYTEVDLLNMEEETLTKGYEGLMVRNPEGPYKMGRSTTNEGHLLKMKRRLQGEATVLGFEEQMHNANEATINALGHTERSSHQANKIPMGVLGALTVKDIVSGVEFNVGTGFTAEERAGIWKQRDSLRGKKISYEYLPVGVKDKPRHPTFLGWRMDEDFS
jgi:DNA ligase 1